MNPERRARLAAALPRKALHVGTGAAAILLPFLERWEAAALAALGLIGNLLWLRFHGSTLIFRAGEGVFGGIVTYPATVLLAILLLPFPEGALCCWGVLALGDGAASVVGIGWGRRPLPWNRGKSLEGSLAFLVFGVLGAFGLLCLGGLPAERGLALALGATLLAALAESLPLPWNDNLSVAAAAALGYLLARGVGA